jgi:hypothetical protein
MNAENVQVNLRYERTDLKSLLRYAKAHDVERSGRYDNGEACREGALWPPTEDWSEKN